MLPYIATNPVTDTIKQNTETAYQRAEKMHTIEQARQRDAALRRGAQIYAEPAPVAPAPITTFNAVPQAGPPAPPTVNMAGNPNPPVPLPDIQQPNIAYPPAPADTRGQRALQVFSNTPGMGDVAMNVAQHNQTQELAQREKMSAHTDKVLELISNGNIQGAKQYAQVHGLTAVLPWFDNPRALMTIGSLGRYAHSMGADWSQAGQFAEKTLSGISQGLSSEEAQLVASREALSQITPFHTENDQGEITAFTKDRQVIPMGRHGRTARTMGANGAPKVHNVVPTGQGFVVLMSDKSQELLRDPTTGKPYTNNAEGKFVADWVLKNADMPGDISKKVNDAKNAALQVFGGTAPNQGGSGRIRQYNSDGTISDVIDQGE